MEERTEGEGAATNQTRLREKLKPGTLAKRLAEAYDATQTSELNRDALKKVVEADLDKVRQDLEEDQNQVG